MISEGRAEGLGCRGEGGGRAGGVVGLESSGQNGRPVGTGWCSNDRPLRVGTHACQ